MKKLFYIISFTLLGLSQVQAAGGCCPDLTFSDASSLENLIEKKKKVTHTHHLSSKDDIHIDNHFGNVKVKIWDKEEVKVNIEITANAETEKKVETFLNIVKIKSEKKNGTVYFTTDLQCLTSAFEDNVGSGPNERNFLKVDYEVWMPQNHNLAVNNSHGDVYIPKFLAVLDLHQKYGNLYADQIRNNYSNIELNFGKGFIKNMKGGQLNAKQTSLLIDVAEDITLTNTCGNVKVLSADNIDMKTTYGKGHVAKVKESCKFQVKYAKAFTLGEIMDNVEELEIESSHTNLELPLNAKGKYELSTVTNNTDLILTEQPKVKYLATSNAQEKKMLIGTDKENEATKVKLKCSYGKVEVK
ncbi:hypothetical protein [Jiulongibacter sp. NS-SX5]|uniref:hypothetical protein n=1 Tax=Jiulongibacter sp. NS-SX5 TaxID=3463854 RepID=UPI0040587D26